MYNLEKVLIDRGLGATPQMLRDAYLDKYSGGKKLLPLQDTTDINRNIKDIAKLCGIDKKVTFHTSRHSTFSLSLKTNDLQKLNLRQVTI